MGHVVNPHLFRLNYTVFWNISTFSKKKFSIFIDLKSLIIYNFFNDYLNNYKNIRKIKLRILKIKISFYCNNIKIFFFFIKHKNLNRNFKKMFNNNFKLNRHYMKKLFYLNDYFLFSNNKYSFYENDNYQDILYEEHNLNIKNSLFKNKVINLKTIRKYYKKRNSYFLKKKSNFLFINSNEKNSDFNYILDANRYNFRVDYNVKAIINYKSLFENMDKLKNLINKNFALILSYYYNYEYSDFNFSNFFDTLNYSMYENFLEKKVPNVPIFRNEKEEVFLEKEKIIRYLNKKRNLKIFNLNFEKPNFEEYVEEIISERNKDNKDYKRFKKKRFLRFFTKNFFFLNIKKKIAKSKSFFANKHYKLFYKRKKIFKRSLVEIDKDMFNYKYKEAIIVDKIKKNIFIKNKYKNFKKIILNDQLENVLTFKSADKNVTFLKENSLFNSEKIKYYIEENEDEENYDNFEDLLNINELSQAEDCVKKEKYVTLLSENLKLNLKIIKNKFLLFNFIKIFLKLKKKMYAVFNRIYLNNIAVIITICLKKYSRWKFTADYLNDLIIVRLKQSHRIKDIMKFIIKYLNRILRKKRIIGYAILLKGRFSRKDRAVYQLKRFGKTKKTNKVSIIDFSNKSVNLTYSKAAISIWVTRHI